MNKRINFKRMAVAASTALVASLTLTACAGGSMNEAGSDKSGDANTIQFWSNHPGSSRDLEEEMIKEFEEENPDLKVKLVDAGSSYEEVAQKLNAALAGNDLPDVFVASDMTWFNFALNGSSENLDELWEKENLNPDSYVDTLREDYNFDGKHYGAPYSRSTTLMYWNTDQLKEAGLPTDRGPKDWKEFAEWADKLKAKTGKPALTMASGDDYLDWYFEGMAWAFGGGYSDDWDLKFTDPKTIEAAKFLQDQVKKGNIEIATDPTVSFGNGNASSFVGSTGSLGGLTEASEVPFITTYLPGPGPSAPTGGAGLAIPSKISDERKSNAIKFIDFLTNTENTIKFSQKTGYMPVRKDALDDPKEKEFLKEHPNAETSIKQLTENTKPQDNARVFVPGGGQRIGGALDRITLGGEDVDEVFSGVEKETQSTIDSQIEPKLK